MAEAATKKRDKAKAAEAAPAVDPVTETAIVSYKGFDSNLQCRGYQFAVGETFEHKGRVEACASGFHACENPWDVLGYYGFIGADGSLNRFARVSQDGDIKRHGSDSKIASGRITIDVELRLPEYVSTLVGWIVDATKLAAAVVRGSETLNDNSGNGAQIGSSGYGARIGSSGYGARIGSSGDGAQIGSSGNGAQIGSSGDGAQIGSSGNGAQIVVSGENASIAVSGYRATAQAGPGGAITLTYWDGTRPRHVTGYVGENGIKADTPYRVVDGELVEAA